MTKRKSCATCGCLMRKIGGEVQECDLDDRRSIGWDYEQWGLPICGQEHDRLDAEWEAEVEHYRGQRGAARWPVADLISTERECNDWCELDITLSAKEHKTMREAEIRFGKQLARMQWQLIATLFAAILSGPVTMWLRDMRSPPPVSPPSVYVTIPERSLTVTATPSPQPPPTDAKR